MAVVFGKRYDDFTSQEGALVEEMVNEGYDLLGTFNWADHLPFLKWLDLQGVRHRCNRLVRQVEAYVGNIIQEHKARRASGSGIADELSGDFVDVLLGLDGEDKMSESDMVAVLWEMIFRGTDTVAILMEWIMARMVVHPEIQSKARAELDAVVGRGRAVTEDDVARLPYIQCIVKETLRMHPPGPLLSWARLAVHDAHVGGHLVPAGTTAMITTISVPGSGSIGGSCSSGCFAPASSASISASSSTKSAPVCACSRRRMACCSAILSDWATANSASVSSMLKGCTWWSGSSASSTSIKAISSSGSGEFGGCLAAIRAARAASLARIYCWIS
ncbi:Cytochrome P450 78A3 [Triticum urartu]|uniref:Cytochrome P450 78A3 n=1 Tax=Triticum urartu TaxID=4572 RepID=M7ZXF2_TRIUA|nr:Cytochrome P450 78A3 [Triticum urartu]